MDKKLTDSEIVKALEVCDNSFCEDCKYHDKLFNCRDNLIRDALDLINRLQAENERLGITVNSYKKMYEDIQHLEMKVDKIKAEAYKECIEKVKEEYADLIEFGYADISVDGLFKKLDNILKELVGEDNAEEKE